MTLSEPEIVKFMNGKWFLRNCAGVWYKNKVKTYGASPLGLKHV